MALDEVAIANQAFGHLGSKSTIESFDELSEEADQAKLWYAQARDQVLEAYDWTFARKETVLSLHGDAPTSRWGFRYSLPSDCLRPRYIPNPLGRKAPVIPYELAMSLDGSTKTLMTDLEEASLVYTFPQTNAALYSVSFVSALSRLLASLCAFSLTGKLDVERTQLQLYNSIILAAGAANANSEGQDQPREAEWIEGR